MEQCFEDLALKVVMNQNLQAIFFLGDDFNCDIFAIVVEQIMEVPSLLEEGSNVVKRNITKLKQDHQAPPSGGTCCL